MPPHDADEGEAVAPVQVVDGLGAHLFEPESAERGEVGGAFVSACGDDDAAIGDGFLYEMVKSVRNLVRVETSGLFNSTSRLVEDYNVQASPMAALISGNLHLRTINGNHSEIATTESTGAYLHDQKQLLMLVRVLVGLVSSQCGFLQEVGIYIYASLCILLVVVLQFLDVYNGLFPGGFQECSSGHYVLEAGAAILQEDLRHADAFLAISGSLFKDLVTTSNTNEGEAIFEGEEPDLFGAHLAEPLSPFVREARRAVFDGGGNDNVPIWDSCVDHGIERVGAGMGIKCFCPHHTPDFWVDNDNLQASPTVMLVSRYLDVVTIYADLGHGALIEANLAFRDGLLPLLQLFAASGISLNHRYTPLIVHSPRVGRKTLIFDQLQSNKILLAHLLFLFGQFTIITFATLVSQGFEPELQFFWLRRTRRRNRWLQLLNMVHVPEEDAFHGVVVKLEA